MIRDKEKLKMEVRNHLVNDKIYVLGIGDNATNFIKKHRNEINIAGLLTDIAGKTGDIEIDGIYYNIYDISEFELTSGSYIINATGNNEYTDVFLQTHGCSTFREYIWSDWYDVFMKDKKVIVFEGGCQIVMAYYFLRTIDVIKDNFLLMVYHEHLYKSRYAMLRWNYYLVICDIFICNNYGKVTKRNHRPNELPKDCLVIKSPRYMFDLYWPSAQKYVLTTYNDLEISDRTLFKIHPHGPFNCGDGFVNEMIEKGISDEEILDTILKHTFMTDAEMNERTVVFLENCKEADKGCDIKFYDYIEENWQKKLIFSDPVHMSVDMYWDICNQILKLLGFDSLENYEVEPDENFDMYLHHCTQIPVYPMVAKQLKLEFVNDDTVYEISYYGGYRNQNFVDYYRNYIKACRLTYELKNVIE